MRLVNLLKLPGGVHEQGRRIKFPLRYLEGRVPATREVEAVMLPLSEVDIHRVTQAAKAAAAEKDASLPESLEYVCRFLQASLRDPGDMSTRLIEDENDLQALRGGLVGRQYVDLPREYEELLATEYPAAPTDEDEEALRTEAGGFSVEPPSVPSSS
jgi:hypothetical protein